MEPHEVLLLALAVWALIYLLSSFLPFERHGIEATPLYLMYRTKRLNNFLSETANRNRRFWRAFANIGVVVAVLEMALAVYYLSNNLLRFLYVPHMAVPVVPFLPGITISLRWFPYILIAIGLAITTHEMAHGVIAFLERIPVKSAGIVLAPITFGGFVEPDEKVFERARLRSKLRVVAAGSLTNLLGGLLTLMLLMALFAPASGLLILSVSEGFPAYEAGIRPWDVIQGINETRINDLFDFFVLMADVGPGTPLRVTTSRGVVDVTTVRSPENASRGIIGLPAGGYVSYFPLRIGSMFTQFSYHFNLMLNWTSILMINLAIFNMLPLFPLDGEKYLYSLLKTRLKRGLREVRVLLNAVFLLLIALNIGLTFIRYGLTPI